MSRTRRIASCPFWARMLTLLGVGWFLALQGWEAAHVAQYGGQRHEHNGQVCAYYILCDQQLHTAAPALFFLEIPRKEETAPLPPVSSLPSSYFFADIRSRAPPLA